MEHPIAGLMETTMQKIKEMVDVNTIIGDPITSPDGTVVIPVSKISYGFVSGGSDIPTKKENKDCFGGGSGAGVTMKPVGFLSVYEGNVEFISVEDYEGPTEKIIGMVPDVVSKISSVFKRDKKGSKKTVKPAKVSDEETINEIIEEDAKLNKEDSI